MSHKRDRSPLALDSPILLSGVFILSKTGASLSQLQDAMLLLLQLRENLLFEKGASPTMTCIYKWVTSLEGERVVGRVEQPLVPTTSAVQRMRERP